MLRKKKNKRPVSFEVGSVINDKYRIDRLLGEGGMGSVYEATMLTIDRKVAIKVLHGQYAKNQELVRRFMQEARIAGSLGHDNICEVTDLVYATDGSPFLVMQLLKGQTLTDLLESAQGGRLSLHRASDIVCQTLSALEAAHEKGIVHRDLKPDNIFITTSGDREDFVKLLDFGVSKMLNRSKKSRLTQTGMNLGTPAYMSPEQIGGAKNTDHRTDIFTMGVILYELVTGQHPFYAELDTAVIAKIITEYPALPHTILPDIPGAFENILWKAMAKAPDGRFQSAAEMKAALAPFRDPAHSSVLQKSQAKTVPLFADRSGNAPFEAHVPLPDDCENIRSRPLSGDGTVDGIAHGDSIVVSTMTTGNHKRRPLIVGFIGVLAVVGVVSLVSFRRTGTPSTVQPQSDLTLAPAPALPMSTSPKPLHLSEDQSPRSHPAFDLSADSTQDRRSTADETTPAAGATSATDKAEGAGTGPERPSPAGPSNSANVPLTVPGETTSATEKRSNRPKHQSRQDDPNRKKESAPEEPSADTDPSPEGKVEETSKRINHVKRKIDGAGTVEFIR